VLHLLGVGTLGDLLLFFTLELLGFRLWSYGDGSWGRLDGAGGFLGRGVGVGTEFAVHGVAAAVGDYEGLVLLCHWFSLSNP
jgi:hypothetical protein